MSGEIQVTRTGTTATVALSNPEKLNALTVAMWRDLATVMQQLSADDELRCVVLRGAGTAAFAAGADIAEFAKVRDTAAQGKVYHRELVSADGLNVVLEFSAKVGERELKGIDMVRFDEDGKIIEFEVMIRPMSGLQALGDEMSRRLAPFLAAAKG